MSDAVRLLVFEQLELGLGQSDSLSVKTGVTAGRHHRDALLANTVIEAENTSGAGKI